MSTNDEVSVRFKVPELELLQCRLVLARHELTKAQWVAGMLTYLCCPVGSEHLAGLWIEAMVPGVDPDVAKFEFRWPRSLILAVDPGLELAELDLPSLLSILWAWLHAPGLLVSPNLACRLAAFASSFRGKPYSWDRAAITPPDYGSASPHYMPEAEQQPDPRALPWNQS